MSPLFCRLVVMRLAVLSAAVLGFSGPLAAQDFQQRNPPGAAANGATQGGVETLTRGPLHEAFAEVVPFDPQPGVTVSVKPPEPIEEMIPDQRPEDENAVWIPGYWGWDEDRNDFIWISGVWRVPPPGGEWVSGYWSQVDQGYQWIAGYWRFAEAQGDTEQVSYLPVPPQSLETGPTSPRPAEDQFWVPGVWMWQQTRYVWRPGYWVPIQPDWVWVPAHYVWTPSGCLFVDGHWDYVLQRRGLSFAPVYFQPAVYRQPAFRYTPLVVVNVQIIQYHLFCRPRYYHYYFGDYYDPRYAQAGIVPWFDLYHSRVGYEPFYVYNRWYHTQRERQPDWSKRIRGEFDYRRRHEAARPPRTYAALAELVRRPEGRPVETLEVAVPLDRAAKLRDFPVRLKPVDQQQRERMDTLRTQVRDFSRERSQREKELRERTQGLPDRPQRTKVARPPISPERLGLAERPERPERPQTPKPPTGLERPEIPKEPVEPKPPAKPGTRERLTPGKPERPEGFERPRPPREREAPGLERPKTPGVPDRPDRRDKPDTPRTPGKPDDAQRQPGDFQRRGPSQPDAGRQRDFRAPGRPDDAQRQREGSGDRGRSDVGGGRSGGRDRPESRRGPPGGDEETERGPQRKR